jgi:hypothetical protein
VRARTDANGSGGINTREITERSDRWQQSARVEAEAAASATLAVYLHTIAVGLINDSKSVVHFQLYR